MANVSLSVRELLTLARVCHKLEVSLSRASGLSVHAVLCLILLYVEKPDCVGKLAELLGIGGPSTSKLLRSLDRRGYITRSLDPLDRRRELITLTPSGLVAAKEALAEAERLTQEIAELHFTPQDDNAFMTPSTTDRV